MERKKRRRREKEGGREEGEGESGSPCLLVCSYVVTRSEVTNGVVLHFALHCPVPIVMYAYFSLCCTFLHSLLLFSVECSVCNP